MRRVERLLEDLKDKNPVMRRRRAVKALGRSRRKETLVWLVIAFGSLLATCAFMLVDVLQLAPVSKAVISAVSLISLTINGVGMLRAFTGDPHGLHVIPALSHSLVSDSDWTVQCLAADALGRIGPEAKNAVPALIDALASPRWQVRVSAADALGRIGLEAKDAGPALVRALNSSCPEIRFRAGQALSRIGPAALAGFFDAMESPTQNQRDQPATQ